MSWFKRGTVAAALLALVLGSGCKTKQPEIKSRNKIVAGSTAPLENLLDFEQRLLQIPPPERFPVNRSLEIAEESLQLSENGGEIKKPYNVQRNNNLELSVSLHSFGLKDFTAEGIIGRLLTKQLWHISREGAETLLYSEQERVTVNEAEVKISLPLDRMIPLSNPSVAPDGLTVLAPEKFRYRIVEPQSKAEDEVEFEMVIHDRNRIKGIYLCKGMDNKKKCIDKSTVFSEEAIPLMVQVIYFRQPSSLSLNYSIIDSQGEITSAGELTHFEEGSTAVSFIGKVPSGEMGSYTLRVELPSSEGRIEDSQEVAFERRGLRIRNLYTCGREDFSGGECQRKVTTFPAGRPPIYYSFQVEAYPPPSEATMHLRCCSGLKRDTPIFLVPAGSPNLYLGREEIDFGRDPPSPCTLEITVNNPASVDRMETKFTLRGNLWRYCKDR